MPVIAPLNKGNYHTTKRRKTTCSPVQSKKAWYHVPRIEIIDGKAEIAYDEVETWFPERWEKKNAKANFIKKNEVTYRLTRI